MTNNSLRSLLPGQFGIGDLLGLMTFAAIALAIMRLPYAYHWKMIAITTLWGFFFLWVQYTSPPGVTRNIRLAVVQGAGMAAWILSSVAETVFFNKLPIRFTIMLSILWIGVLGLQVGATIAQVRHALQAEKKQG